MRLEDCYRLLDLRPDASRDDVKQAYRELTKVWHPDRFGHDAALRARAEEKLKAINEAYATIVSSSAPRTRRHGVWPLAFALLGAFLLIRRPTLGGLIVAAVLFLAAALIVYRMRVRR
jgi:hypothetical protein